MKSGFSSGLFVLPLVAALAACGGSPAPTAPTADGSKAAGSEPTGVGKPAPGKRGASAALRERFAAPKNAEVFAYGDVEGAVTTDLVREVAPGFLLLMPASMQECARAWMTSFKEVAVARKDEELLVVLRVDPADKKAFTCLREQQEFVTAIAVPGATEAFSKNDRVIARESGFLFLGSKELVTKALARSRSEWPSALDLGKDQYFSLELRGSEKEGLVAGHAVVEAAPDHAGLNAEMELTSDEVAQSVEAGYAAMQKGLLGEVPSDMSGAFTLKRTGKHLTVALRVSGAPKDQAKQIGDLAAMAQASLRKYLVRTKQAEVRNTLGFLGKNLVEWWESDQQKDAKGKAIPRDKRKLVSFPAVPKTVPKGEKYQSTKADWEPWQTLNFAYDMPQYFQYEIRASKDGKSAEIIGRGDLNGDGKTSLFTIVAKVTGPERRLLLSPSIEEKDPDE